MNLVARASRLALAFAHERPRAQVTGSGREEGDVDAHGSSPRCGARYGRQHFLYFLPLPQGHGSLGPTFTTRGAGAAGGAAGFIIA